MDLENIRAKSDSIKSQIQDNQKTVEHSSVPDSILSSDLTDKEYLQLLNKIPYRGLNDKRSPDVTDLSGGLMMSLLPYKTPVDKWDLYSNLDHNKKMERYSSDEYWFNEEYADYYTGNEKNTERQDLLNRMKANIKESYE